MTEYCDKSNSLLFTSEPGHTPLWEMEICDHLRVTFSYYLVSWRKLWCGLSVDVVSQGVIVTITGCLFLVPLSIFLWETNGFQRCQGE